VAKALPVLLARTFVHHYSCSVDLHAAKIALAQLFSLIFLKWMRLGLSQYSVKR
jgi:hypothetical protein